MKAFKYFGVALLALAIGITYVSCNKDDKDDQGMQDLIGIENATFIDGKIPSVSDTQTKVIASSNSSALAGGANIITITSPVELEKLFVALKGLNGYYSVTPISTGHYSGTYVYQITVNYGTGLNQDVIIIINARTVDGSVVSVVEQEVSYVESKSGALAINLVFDQDKDVDLHLFLPSGAPIEHVYYSNTGIFTGTAEDYAAIQEQAQKIWKDLLKKYGYSSDTDEDDIDDDDFWREYYAKMEDLEGENFSGLDHDSNADCDIDHLNNENIVMHAPALVPGVYKVYVNMYRNCSSSYAATKWTVISRFLDQELTATQGNNPASGEFAADVSNNVYDDVSRMSLAMTFSLTQSQIDKAKSNTRAAYDTRFIPAPPSFRSMLKAMENGSWQRTPHHRLFK